MSITVLHVEDCPHTELVRARLAEALERLGLTATVVERVVVDAAEADALGFGGSPTVLVDGHDPFPAAAPVGLACRLHVPSVDELVEVLGRAS